MRERLNLIDACDKAAKIVSLGQEMSTLYRMAVQCRGAGELRMEILSIAADALQDEDMKNEVFVSNESMLSFLCGVWIQFLLIEIAGVKKEQLKSLAKAVFTDVRKGELLH